MEKKRIENDLDILYSRNKFMTRLITIFVFISIIVNLFFDPAILAVIAPYGIILCVIVLTITSKKLSPIFTLYTIVTVTFLFLFILISAEPILVNFIFLWLGLIISAVYYRVGPILYACLLTNLLSVYFFFTNRESIFVAQDTVDIVYIILFTLFMTAFLIFTCIITERLRVRAELGEQAATKELFAVKGYFESLFYHMTDAVVIHNLEGKVLQVNKSFQDLYQWNEEEVLDKQIPYVKEEHFQYLSKLWMKVFTEGKGIEQIEMKHITKEGKVVDVAISISPIQDNEGTVMALATFSKDISDKLQTEEIIRRSEKLSVVGQLAAGVAHEIRNPLTVISGFLQLHQETYKENEYHPLMLSEINRINNIISEFLVLAKPQLENFEEVEFRSLVKEVTTLINTTAIMKSIKLQIHFQIESCQVYCEPNQIKQVLINLLKNSIEAMEEGGLITVTVRKENTQELKIEITDTGSGIPTEQLARLGEPFFTTKEKGTGLGLMICFKIIENHKGTMVFHSIEGKGTTVEIRLPYSK